MCPPPMRSLSNSAVDLIHTGPYRRIDSQTSAKFHPHFSTLANANLGHPG